MTTIRARYCNGYIQPIESLAIAEGAELLITIEDGEVSTKTKDEATESTAGSWSDLIDCEEFERLVYESRKIHTRSPVDL